MSHTVHLTSAEGQHQCDQCQRHTLPADDDDDGDDDGDSAKPLSIHPSIVLCLQLSTAWN